MNVALIGAIVRHVLTALGGILVATGMFSEEDNQLLVGSSGAFAMAIALAWSLYQKKRAAKSVAPGDTGGAKEGVQ